jgi:hypothetical protein
MYRLDIIIYIYYVYIYINIIIYIYIYILSLQTNIQIWSCLKMGYTVPQCMHQCWGSFSIVRQIQMEEHLEVFTLFHLNPIYFLALDTVASFFWD